MLFSPLRTKIVRDLLIYIDMWLKKSLKVVRYYLRPRLVEGDEDNIS